MTTSKAPNAFTIRKPDPKLKPVATRVLEKDQYFDASGRVVRGPAEFGQNWDNPYGRVRGKILPKVAAKADPADTYKRISRSSI